MLKYFQTITIGWGVQQYIPTLLFFNILQYSVIYTEKVQRKVSELLNNKDLNQYLPNFQMFAIRFIAKLAVDADTFSAG